MTGQAEQANGKQGKVNMILLARSQGKNSNRLLQNVAYEAFSLEYGVRFVNATLGDMARHYPNLRSRGVLATRATEIAGTILTPITLEPRDTAELLAHAGKKLVLVGGRGYRDVPLESKWRPEISRKFSVNEKILQSTLVHQRQIQWKKSGHEIVGVHVRRGDYAEWRQGRHFYSDDVYLEHVERIGATSDARFVIFPSHDHPFSDSEEIVVSTNDWSYDHWLMANCDYLIGPPSTFTMWASYLGDIKYYRIKNPAYEFSRDKLESQWANQQFL